MKPKTKTKLQEERKPKWYDQGRIQRSEERRNTNTKTGKTEKDKAKHKSSKTIRSQKRNTH